MKKLLLLLSSILILISVSCSSEEDEIVGDTSSSDIWSGPMVQFSKEDGSDSSQESNQDRITSNVWITRGNGGQIFNIAKEKSNDLVYFVEDDYIHKKETIIEMVSTYEKIATELDRELFLCPVDYPYLYKKLDNSNILIGNNYHWRTVNESLLTFLTSKDLINKYWNELLLMAENEHSPFETPLHKIYEKELCLSPIPSLAMHCTNVNSIFGLSPNMNWKKLWDENEI